MKILRKFYSSVLLVACLAAGASALPEGAAVTHGNVQITTSGGTQTIVQGSDKAIINWNGFNIDIGELVQFIQPSSLSAILNRVVGQDPSLILGSLQANGQVFLINPNGVVFGDSARVDVGSLVVSTLNITDDNFLQGNLHFEQAADQDLAAVINHGTIKIDNNGFLVLTGPMVANEGVILARVGQVALAGGTKSTVSFDPTGMIQVELPNGSQSSDGIVSLTQDATSELLANLVTAPGTQAGQLVVRDGRTYLEVASGTVINTGEIKTDGIDHQDAGRIVLDSSANTLLASGSVLSASGAGANSSGGEIYVLSDGRAVSAKGSLIDVSGGDGGDGGFAEQSSATGRVAATVDLSAADGKAGRFLIDPERIVVQTGDGSQSQDPGPGFVAVTQEFIEDHTSGTVELKTDDGIEFETFLNGVLALQSNVNLLLELTNPGGDGGPAISFSGEGGLIALAGTGTFTLVSATDTDVLGLRVQTESGDISADIGQGEFFATILTSDTGNIDVTGQGFLLGLATLGDASVESTGVMTLLGAGVENFTGTGNTFEIDGDLVATNQIEFDITGNVGGYASIIAPDVKIKANSVVQANPTPELDPYLTVIEADNLEIEADHILVDFRTLNSEAPQHTLSVINPTGKTEIRSWGEALFLSDEVYLVQGENSERYVTVRNQDELDSITYVTQGDINDLSIMGSTVNLVTDGFVWGNAEAETLNITASEIDISSSVLEDQTLDLVATSGDITLRLRQPWEWNEARSNVNLSAEAQAGSIYAMDDWEGEAVSMNLTVDLLARDLTDLFFNDSSISGIFDSPRLQVFAGNGDVSLLQSGTQDVTVSGWSGSGHELNITTVGDLAIHDVEGSIVSLTAAGAESDIVMSQEEGSRAVWADTVKLQAGRSIDAEVSAYEIDITTGTGSATVTVPGGEGPGSNVLVLADVGESLTLNTQGRIYVGEISAGENVTINAGDSSIEGPGESPFAGTITASSVNLTAQNIYASVIAPTVSVTATAQGEGTVYLDLLSDSAVSGNATYSMYIASEDHNIVVDGAGLSASSEIFLDAGGTLSGTGVVNASSVNLDGSSIDVVLGGDVVNVQSNSTGDTTLTANRGTTEGMSFTGGTRSESSYTFQNNVGTINTNFDQIGSDHIVLVAGTGIDSNLNSSQVRATTGNGGITLGLLSENTTVDAVATGQTGFIALNGTGNITVGSELGLSATDGISIVTGGGVSGTGAINAPSASIYADSISVVLGALTETILTSSSGSTTISGNTASLAVNADVGEGSDITVSNTGDVSVLAAKGTVGGSSSGLYQVIGSGDLNVGNITAGTISLEAQETQGEVGDITSATGTRLVADAISADGGSVNIETRTQTISAQGVDDVIVNNSGSDVTSAVLTAGLGAVDFSTDGNVSGLNVSALSADLSATGALSGTVDTTYQTQIQAGSVNLTSLSAAGLNLTTTSGNAVVQASPNTGAFELRGSVAGNLDLTTSSGDIVLYQLAAGGQADLRATNGGIRHNSEAPGTLTATTANLNALNNIDVNLNASSVNAVSSNGEVSLASVSASPLTVRGTAAGDFTVQAQGGIQHRAVSGANITLTTSSGTDITGGDGTSADALTTAGTVTLSGRNISADTNAGAINATALNDATVSNFSSAVNSVNIEAGRDAEFNSVGTANIETLSSGNNLSLDVGQAVSGTFSGNSVTLAGTELDVTVNANQLKATARNGNATIQSNSTGLLAVSDSSASGNFNLTHQGSVSFDRIQAQNVTLTAGGDITDTANTIIASGITLTGNNIYVNTQGQVIVISARGNVTVANTTVNVDSLTIDADGNVSFDSSGNLAIREVSGGQLVSLTAGANITKTESGSFVAGNNVKLKAGGSITPDLDDPLNVLATESIEVTAHTSSILGQSIVLTPDQIAAALSGELPLSSLLVGDGSGPIYYNGVLVNGQPVPDIPVIPPTPLNEVTDQLGQQNGQVVDDGSMGSAANDGIVEQSPTQKLVAQLTEAAAGGGDSGGLETSVLITLEVDALGEVQVKLGKPSPYDDAIQNSENMSADNILDLETEELTDVKVALYYDPATDQLIMAIDLRADDIIDLDVSEFQEIPIKLDYSFLSDPKMLIEKLRADHLIDLEVEDLGNIPIRVHVEGDDRSASE